VFKSAPGVAFHPWAQQGHFFVVDRATGEVLGIIWRCSDHSWAATDPDGELLFYGRTGTRHEIGASLLKATP